MVVNYEGHSLAVFEKIYTEIGTGIINPLLEQTPDSHFVLRLFDKGENMIVILTKKTR